jgi:undecaprenyl diphosphate synthase
MNFTLQSSLHVAVIMDGNGRWATARGLPRKAGHQAGAESLRRAVEAAPDCGIGTLTAYAFSCDNWKRPAEEVDAIMALLAWYLEDEIPRMLAEGVRLSVIGRRDRLPDSLARIIEDAETATRHCARLHLRLAIDYSGRESILTATRSCAGAPVTRELFEQTLVDTNRGGAQPVDLMIRTGGEQRLSDFLLWECAYAELVFTPRMWPDFGRDDLARAVTDFRRRERRFGDVPAAVHSPQASRGSDRWLR